MKEKMAKFKRKELVLYKGTLAIVKWVYDREQLESVYKIHVWSWDKTLIVSETDLAVPEATD